MPTPAGLPVCPPARSVREQVLVIALATYAAASLISMAVMSIGAAFAAAAILWVAGGPRNLGREVLSFSRLAGFGRYFRASLALLAACALSTIMAYFVPVGWGGRFVHPAWEDFGKYWYFLWPLVLFMGLRKVGESGRRTVLQAWLLALAAVSIVGVIQYYTGWPRPQRIPSSPEHYHATMFLGHHLSAASILIFPFFATLDLLRRSVGGPGRLFSSPVLALVAILGFSALFLGYSRMLWVALPLGVALWAARALTRRQVTGVFVAGAVAIFALIQSSPVRERITNGMGIGERQKLWMANLEFFRLRPFTGTGFRRNIDASSYYLESLAASKSDWIFSGHAHNNLLDMLGGTGLIGALAWLAWCAVVFSILWRGLKLGSGRSGFAWAMICAWVVFHLNGLTQVNFWEGKVMHQMMWAVAWSFLWLPGVESNSVGSNDRKMDIQPRLTRRRGVE